jgi:hypothetical protein
MKKLDFPSHFEAMGLEFEARIKSAGVYQHPTGTGDDREDTVRQYLRDVLSPRFSVDRGKIFDSEGCLSREFDIIISEARDVAPVISLAGRRIVPIEAVYGVIEVKSYLKPDEYDKFIDAVVELDQMRRYYKPLSPFHVVDSAALEAGLPPQDNRVGQVWSGIIALDAAQGETLRQYLTRCCEGFWFICIPGREFVSLRINPPGWRGLPYGLKSLPVLIWMIMNIVSSNTRPNHFLPDFSRYRSQVVNAIGGLTDTWVANEILD